MKKLGITLDKNQSLQVKIYRLKELIVSAKVSKRNEKMG